MKYISKNFEEVKRLEETIAIATKCSDFDSDYVSSLLNKLDFFYSLEKEQIKNSSEHNLNQFKTSINVN